MKKRVALLMGVLMLVGTTACSFGGPAPVDPAEISATTVSVHSDGTIEQTIVEDFSNEKYDLAELNQMILDEVVDYNSENGAGSIELTYIDLTGTICTVSLKFASADDYTKYVQEDLFVGTVKEALDEGYDLDTLLKSAKDFDTTIGLTELAGMGDKHIVICENAYRIRTDGKVLYLSEDAKFIDKYEVDGYMNDTDTIVVFK